MDLEKKIIILVDRERRNYLFASFCSAFTALLLFYKLFHNDLYLKILEHKWFALVVGAMTIGNSIHGYFAFKSFDATGRVKDLDDILAIKYAYYKSMLFYFFTPYFLTIVLFISLKEYQVAFLATLLLAIMVSVCYFFDLKPILRLKKSKNFTGLP